MFLTLIHVGGGSAVEAANPADALGPYTTVQGAIEAGNAVISAVRHISFLNEECFFTLVKIPDPSRDPHTVIAALLAEYGEE